MSISVLMYHNLYRSESELADMPLEEKPYAISEETFREHLDFIKTSKIEISVSLNNETESSKKQVMITFDDGHKSFFDIAFPILKEYKVPAIFFITPELMNSRKDFCSWEQLKEMSENGMTIGSHGLTHQFLENMNESDATYELKESKRLIEENVSNKVDTVSFPGGRYSMKTIKIAESLGYESLFNSIPDLHSSGSLIPRFAIRSNTTIEHFKKFCGERSFFTFKLLFYFKLKQLLKRLLGNNNYHEFYKLIKK